MIKICEDNNIILTHFTTYYPQSNGLDESSNTILIRIIKKLLHENKKDWHKKLIFSLWEDKIIFKKSIRTSPFQLGYGTKVVFTTFLGFQLWSCCRRKKQSLVTFKGGSTNWFMFNIWEKRSIITPIYFKKIWRIFLIREPKLLISRLMMKCWNEMLEMKKKENMESLIISGRDPIRSLLIMEIMPTF